MPLVLVRVSLPLTFDFLNISLGSLWKLVRRE